MIRTNHEGQIVGLDKDPSGMYLEGAYLGYEQDGVHVQEFFPENTLDSFDCPENIKVVFSTLIMLNVEEVTLTMVRYAPENTAFPNIKQYTNSPKLIAEYFGVPVSGIEEEPTMALFLLCNQLSIFDCVVGVTGLELVL
jgi:hypothetical protein